MDNDAFDVETLWIVPEADKPRLRPHIYHREWDLRSVLRVCRDSYADGVGGSSSGENVRWRDLEGQG